MLVPLLYADFVNQIYQLRGKRVSLATICAEKFGLEFAFDGQGLSVPVQLTVGGPTNSPTFIGDALGLIEAAILDQANAYTVLAEFAPAGPVQVGMDTLAGITVFQFNEFAGGFPSGTGFRLRVAATTLESLTPPLFIMDYQGAAVSPMPPPGVALLNASAPVQWDQSNTMAIGLLRDEALNYSYACFLNGADMAAGQTPSTTKPGTFVPNIVEANIACNGRNPAALSNEALGHMMRVAIYTQADVPPGSYPFYSIPSNFPAAPWPNVPPPILTPPVPTPLPCIPCCHTAAPVCPCGPAVHDH